jgi:hypothetical protein
MQPGLPRITWIARLFGEAEQDDLVASYKYDRYSIEFQNPGKYPGKHISSDDM